MDDADSFREFFREKTRGDGRITVLALVGSGLSAASGLRPYGGGDEDGGDGRDVGAVAWRNYTAIDLATPDAFETNPALVWMFYAYRRHRALAATPNGGHRLLATLSRLSEHVDFLTITQNTDGLHQRAGHAAEQLLEFHGSLFELRCTSFLCSYRSVSRKDPLTPALDVSKYAGDPAAADDDDSGNGDPAATAPLPAVTELAQLPTCPLCTSLLRPGVLWFGEALPLQLLDRADEFIVDHRFDVLLVVGTSHSVWPTAAYLDLVRNQGARIAVFNTVRDPEIDRMAPATPVWQFVGDCAHTLPQVFAPILADWGHRPV